jgi:hypothetical protein
MAAGDTCFDRIPRAASTRAAGSVRTAIPEPTMDAIAFENNHYAYQLQNVQASESSMAGEDDELAIYVNPLSGEVRFDYSPKASANLRYEQFWDHATAWVSQRFGLIIGESLGAEGVRYFSIALDRGLSKGGKTIHVYVSKVNASETPAPDDGSFVGGSGGK